MCEGAMVDETEGVEGRIGEEEVFSTLLPLLDVELELLLTEKTGVGESGSGGGCG